MYCAESCFGAVSVPNTGPALELINASTKTDKSYYKTIIVTSFYYCAQVLTGKLINFMIFYSFFNLNFLKVPLSSQQQQQQRHASEILCSLRFTRRYLQVLSPWTWRPLIARRVRDHLRNNLYSPERTVLGEII